MRDAGEGLEIGGGSGWRRVHDSKAKAKPAAGGHVDHGEDSLLPQDGRLLGGRLELIHPQKTGVSRNHLPLSCTPLGSIFCHFGILMCKIAKCYLPRETWLALLFPYKLFWHRGVGLPITCVCFVLPSEF